MERNVAEVAKRRGRKPKEDKFNEYVEEDSMEQVEKYVSRPDVRSEMRGEDSKARAARRAAEIRGHIGEMNDGTDEFFIDVSIIPEGWSYEWKRKTLWGQEDASYTVHLARMGWEPVPSSRHPEMMPSGWAHNTIERKGLILMERPSEVVDEARNIERRKARSQVRAKEEQLAGTPDGTFTRDHDRVKPRINKGWEAMPVPEE